MRDSSGRRWETESYSGKQVGSRIPNGKPTSLSVDATIKAAALSGNISNGNISVEESDIRERVFERKTGVTILFLVDASGSMGARRRMSAVKGAMLSILTDAYQKRDRVGLVTFRGNRAEVLVPPTNSVELAKKRMELMPTGGKTPLAHGLYLAEKTILNEMNRRPNDIYLLTVISDGKGNVPLTDDSSEDIRRISADIVDKNIHCLVLDTETGMIKLGMARKLADQLGARYMRLEDIGSESIKNAARQTLGV